LGISISAVLNSDFSIRRTCGAIGVLTAHFRLFLLRFFANSALLVPHSHQNTLEKRIRLHRKSSWKFWIALKNFIRLCDA